MKLRKEFKDVLEHILNIRYGNYTNLQRMKETGIEELVSIDSVIYNHRVNEDTMKQLDSLIKYAHQEYLDALQFVVALGYESFIDEEHSKFCDSGRVHRIFSKEELNDMEVTNSIYTLEEINHE